MPLPFVEGALIVRTTEAEDRYSSFPADTG
jgi:hypothetical protein